MLQTRSAKRPAQAAVRFAVDAVGRGPARPRARDRDDRPGRARRAAAPDLRPDRRLRRDRPRRGRLAGRRQGRDRAVRGGGGARRRGGARGDPRPRVHRGRRRGGLPRRPRDPHERGRQGEPRGAGRPRHGPPGRHRARERSRSTWRPARCGSGRACCARAIGSRSTAATARSRPMTCRSSSRRSRSSCRPCWAGATSCARSASVPTPTPRPTRARRSSWAPKASACAAPSTCSWASASR